MTKKKKMIMLTIVSVLFIILGGMAIIGSEIGEEKINEGTSNIVSTQKETTVEEQKEFFTV